MHRQMTELAKAKNTEIIQAIYASLECDNSEIVTALRKPMKQRKMYALYEFDGKQVSGVTLRKALEMTLNATLPSDEWAIVDEATGKIVIEKKPELSLLTGEAMSKYCISHGASETA